MTHNVMMRFHNTPPHSATDGAQKQPSGCSEAAVPLLRPRAEPQPEQAGTERVPREAGFKVSSGEGRASAAAAETFPPFPAVPYPGLRAAFHWAAKKAATRSALPSSHRDPPPGASPAGNFPTPPLFSFRAGSHVSQTLR